MSTSGARAFASQAGFLAVVRVLSIAAGFLTAAFGARVLGPDGMGAAGVGLTVAAVAAVALNGGVNISTIYFLGRLPGQRRSVLSAVLPIASIGAALAACALLALTPAISAFVGLTNEAEVLRWSSLLAASVIAYEFVGALLLGFGRIQGYIRLELTKAVATLGATVLVLSLHPSAAGFVGAAIIGQAVGIAIMVRRIRPDSRDAKPGVRAAITRQALSVGIRGQAGNFLQLLNLRLDQLLVPAMLSLTAGGIYIVAVRLAEALAQVGSASATLIFPEVSRQADTTLTVLTEQAVRATTLLVAVGALALAAIATPVLEIAFGPEFASGAAALRLLLAATIPLSVSRVLAADLKGRGRPGLVSAVMGGAVGLTILLDVLLIPVLGIAGAAVASLIAYSATAAALAISFIRLTGAEARALVPTGTDAKRLVRLIRAQRR